MSRQRVIRRLAALLAPTLALLTSPGPPAPAARAETAQPARPVDATATVWPCVQPLVPTLAAAMVWSGPPLEGLVDWRTEPAAADLVRRISPETVETSNGIAAIQAFAAPLAAPDRKRLLPVAFSGLLDETNRRRGLLISRIEDLGERQRNLAATVAGLSARIDALSGPASGPAAATVPQPGGGAVAESAGRPAASPELEDLERRRFFLSRAYAEAERTIRYACEAPSQLDARLGAYARAIEALLK